MTRRERQAFERKQLLAAAFGATTLPGAGPDKPRFTVLLSDLIRRPATWAMWLADAMLRRRKGCRLDSTRRLPPEGAARWRGERRADKPGMSKLARRLGKLHWFA